MNNDIGNIKEMKKLHNLLLKMIGMLESVNEDNLLDYDKEILLSIKTEIVNEIDKIRKDLKINTSTYIDN